MSKAPAPASPARRRRFTVESLFADTTPRGVGVTDLVDAKEIRLDRIEPDPNQPRQTFDEERLEELAASMRREGVLQPIAVRYASEQDRYIILHGERRWRAARLAGLESIPAIVRDVPTERRLIQQLMENVVREDLNAIDRAAALRALKTQMGDATWEHVAEAVGIKRSRLFQLLGTEKLPEIVQAELRAGRLSEKQTRVLQGLPDQAQEALARLILHENVPHDTAQRLARAARDDDEFAQLDEEAAHERFQSMRASMEERRKARGQRQRRAADLTDDLRDFLSPEERDVALEPVSIDDLSQQVRALARSVAAFPASRLSAAERSSGEAELRRLRDLIDVVLSHRTR